MTYQTSYFTLTLLEEFHFSRDPVGPYRCVGPGRRNSTFPDSPVTPRRPLGEIPPLPTTPQRALVGVWDPAGEIPPVPNTPARPRRLVGPGSRNSTFPDSPPRPRRRVGPDSTGRVNDESVEVQGCKSETL